MRHSNKNRKFGREKNQRVALMKSLARNLIIHEKIDTTEAKAKELRPYIEKMVTLAKRDTLLSKRLLTARLSSALQSKKLYKDIAPRYAKRAGGYTRIMKLNRRLSDGSKMARIEFI